MSSHKICRRWPAVMGSRCGGWVRRRMRAMQESVCQPGGGEAEGGGVEPPTLGFFAGIVESYRPTGALQRVFSQKRKLKTAFLNSCCQKTHSAASGTHYNSQHAFVVSQHFSYSLPCHIGCPTQLLIFLSVYFFHWHAREMNCFP